MSNMLTQADIQFITDNEKGDVSRLLLGKAPQGVNLQLCCKCIQAREKMRIKAPLWHSNPALVYPFSVSVEQGSSQTTALFKQKIIAELFSGDSQRGNNADFPRGIENSGSLSGKEGVFPRGKEKCDGLSGKEGVFPRGMENSDSLSGKEGVFPRGIENSDSLSGIEGVFPRGTENCSSLSTKGGIFVDGQGNLVERGECGSESSGRKIVTADLTGGMGIDSYFISRIADKHFYFERNGELCAATAYNLEQLGAENVVLQNRDVTVDDCAALRELECEGISLLYIDPARRTETGGKAILLQDYEPNVIELQERMFAVSRYILVKVSPMADIKLNLKHLPKTRAVYVVAVDNECKELLFLLDREHAAACCVNGNAVSVANDSSNNPANGAATGCEHNGTEPVIYCVDCNSRTGEIGTFELKVSEEEEAAAKFAGTIGAYLYEPGKAVMKGGAYKLVSQRFNCGKLAPSTHLYTSDTLIKDFPGKVFSVEEVIPFNKKALKELAKRCPKADLTARNFPLDTNSLKKLSGIKDGGTKHIFAVTLSNGDKVLIITAYVVYL